MQKRDRRYSMTKIGFIRHGSTAWNQAGRAQGHSDIPLSDEGHMQADILANRLAEESWDAIYSSDLQRAHQTAQAIAANGQDLNIHLDTRLRERFGGETEGTTLAERIEKWGDNWRELDLGMEQGEEISERGMACLEDIIANHPDENILIVSHGAFIKQLLRTLFPNRDVEGSLDNCSVTTIETEGETWQLTLHNCVRHFQTVGKNK